MSPPTRCAINVPLARRDQRPSQAVVAILVRASLGADVGLDRIHDRRVGAARLVLVDHGGALAVVARQDVGL